jgi:ribosomal protein S18 acetylase RimI-like enzyme
MDDRIAIDKSMPDQLKNPVGAEDSKQRCLFRESSASDEPAVRKILRGANLSFHESNDIAKNPSHESRRPALPPVGSTFTCLCDLDSEVVAVLQWRHLGEEAEILDVAVPARHRRKGYARFLLKNFLQLAHDRGIGELFLEVRESNAAALALYSEFEFEATGRRPNYYRDPAEAALLLRLKLTD